MSPETDPGRNPDGAQGPTEAVRAHRGAAHDGLDRLWAPWRSAYVVDDDAPPGCPFCVGPARGDDAAALIVARGEHVFTVMNAYPYNPGHVMVVPYEHVPDLSGLAPEASAELWREAQRAVAVLRDVLGAGGVNLGMNLGSNAGAGIPDHLHLHAVPRWRGDTNFMSVTASARVLPVALQELWPRLRAGLAGGDG